MKTIIEMAREASNTPIDHHATPDLFGINQIERFAELVRADEREACAKVAWDYGWRRVDNCDVQSAAVEIHDAIRARGNT